MTDKSIKVVVAHPFKQHSFETAKSFQKNGNLYKYCTTVYDKNNSFTSIIKKFLSGKELQKANTRKCADIEDKVIQFCEIEGLVCLAIGRIPFLKKFQNNIQIHLSKRFSKKVANYAKREQIDVLIMYDCNAMPCFEILKDTNIVKILDMSTTTRDYAKDVFVNDMKKYNHNYFYREYKYLWNEKLMKQYNKELEYADYFLSPSDLVSNSLIYCKVDKNKILKVPYGVNINKFDYNKKDKVNMPLKFLYVGKCSYRKGIHHLLSVVSQYNNIELYLAGDYDKREHYYTLYKDYENIHFLGFITRNEINEIFKKCHIFILPSLIEGMALVGLEALSSGMPLILSDNSGISEYINNYKNGIVTDHESEKDLKDAIDFMLNNKEKIFKMGEESRTISNNFTWEMYHINIYNKIMKIMEDRK